MNLGTVAHQQVKSANIITGKGSLSSGIVIFHLSWTNGSSGSDQLGASYRAINNCPNQNPNANFCPDNPSNNQGTCGWTTLEGAVGYNVVVKENDTGDIIQSISVGKDATQSAFPMIPGKPYVCSVTPVNECGSGKNNVSPEKICNAPTITPSPTPPPQACLNGSTSQGVCSWDSLDSANSYNITVKDLSSGKIIVTDTVQAPTTQFSFNDNGIDTYECDVTANNICGNSTLAKSPPSTCTSPTPTPNVSVSPTPTPGVSPTPTPQPSPTSTPTPTPTPTPAPTATPIPTATPKPLPTPTPVVIVKILTPPPQQIVITSPPQQTIVRVPGQTQTIVQQGPPQTVVQQPQPTARPFSPVTPVPTVMATGNTTPSFIIAGTSAILLIAGGIIFFLL